MSVIAVLNEKLQTNKYTAIDVVRSGSKVKIAAATFNVPRIILRLRVKWATSKTVKYALIKGLGSHKPVFSKEEVQQLCYHILELESRMFRLSIIVLRRLTLQFAETYDIPHSFNMESELADEGWVATYRKRSPPPDNPSGSRGYQCSAGYRFQTCKRHRLFDNLEAILDK